jgi:integrase
MANTDRRRRGHRGAAWYWSQTDCWYYTPTGTKRRVPLVDDDGKRIRGKENRSSAMLAVARAKLTTDWRPESKDAPDNVNDAKPSLVAGICSEYVESSQRRMAAGAINTEYGQAITQYLNEFCGYCGALPVTELKRGHVQFWVESHQQWRPVTRRNPITIVLAAFNYAEREHGIRNPLKGLKKPEIQPRLQSFSASDEQAMYQATDKCFGNFLFASLHTGLRPYCELARLKAGDVKETPLGMMWCVYSSKTKKRRKIPVRPDVALLTRKLMARTPAGADQMVFRNPQGNPWKKVTGVKRFLAIKRTLGWDKDLMKTRFSTYTCRHTFAHRMLSGYWNNGAGCSIEILAELLGNTPKVAFDHYGREWGQHYQDPLWSAIGMPSAEPTKRRSKRSVPARPRQTPTTIRRPK